MNDAKQKMNLLLNPSNEILNVIVNLYNGTNVSGGGMSVTGGNPFSVNSISNAQQNTNSIFGSSAGGSTFGSVNQQTNPFASNASGFTGSGNQNANLFGGGNLGGGGSVFGGTGSTFGGNTSQSFGGSAPNQTTSFYGGTTNTNPAQGPFSQGTASTGGPFSQTTSVFDSARPVFGGPPSFGSKPSGLFGQTNTGTPNQGGSMFGQPFGGTTSNTQSIFGGTGAQNQQQQSIFGQVRPAQNQGNIFANGNNVATNNNLFGGLNRNINENTMSMSEPSPTNIFGSVQQQQQQQQQPTANIFGSSPFQQQPQQASNLLNNNPSNNAFGITDQTQTSGIQPNLQQQQQSIFGGAAINSNVTQNSKPIFGSNTSGNPTFIASTLFKQTEQYQQQQQRQIQLQQQQVQQYYGGQQTTTVLPPPTSNASISKYYTDIKDLSGNEIELFKADSFELGKLPTRPPPRELCI